MMIIDRPIVAQCNYQGGPKMLHKNRTASTTTSVTLLIIDVGLRW